MNSLIYILLDFIEIYLFLQKVDPIIHVASCGLFYPFILNIFLVHKYRTT